MATQAETKEQKALAAKGYWACEHCTFVNASSELHCNICYKPRFEIKDLPYQWQWQAAEEWITYDLPSSIEIESGFEI